MADETSTAEEQEEVAIKLESPSKDEADGEAAEETTSKANLPGVITVDTKTENDDKDEGAENDPDATEQEKGLMQARTPKHANKMRDEDAKIDQQQNTPDRGGHKVPAPHHEGRHAFPSLPQRGEYGSFPPPPRGPYDGRPPPQVGGNGAFQPHERRQHPPPANPERAYYNRPPMQVSPGNGANVDYPRRNYPSYPGRGGPPPSRMEAGYPPNQGHPGYYEQRGAYNDYPPARPPAGYEGRPRGQYGPPSGPPPSYPPQNFNRYQLDARGNPQAWGPLPPPYSHPQGGQYPPGSRPPEHYQRPPSATHDPAYVTEHHTGNTPFSRSVSTSFDRSVKSSRPDERMRLPESKMIKQSSPTPGEITQNASVASDDCSWKQLKQVHSVDDVAMRDPIVKTSSEEDDREPASNSSSLTNSPTEGGGRLNAKKHAEAVVEAVANAVAAQPSSLDSLSSVASAQPPMETSNKAGAPQSPGSISASLDLMKCHSGSSGLLHLPPQQRQIAGMLMDGKRAREDEEVRDDNTSDEAMEGGDEIRRAPSEEQPAPKRVRMQDEKPDAKKKSSPMSITCSPSAPKQNPKIQNKLDYHTSPQPMEGSFYDKPPAFTYSIDSAPSLPRDSHHKQPSYNSLPPRPGSSNSTITGGPMHMDARDPANAMVPSIASWEIHAQDSFGNGSVGGGQGLASSFSFQDYPALSASESNLGANGVDHGPPGPHHHGSMHAAIESRNQSFEGGHYHGGGSFHRNDSMDYGGRVGPYSDGFKHGHAGSFPPHAPSWGTAASGGSHPSSYQQHGPPPGHYSQYGARNYPPHGGMMRNYSQESHRASPPPGSHSRVLPVHGAPPGFQPPPEFAAPHNPNLARRPPPAVYIMSSSQQGGGSAGGKRGPGGAFTWTKDDDLRLSEVMKKFKNPRDWEPIAKEHGSGKSAKECHERWIRYLKPGVRKGQWTDHEDAIVIEAVSTSSEQPFTRWSDLAQRLPGRVGKQIRDRWVNHLNPNINHLPFSREDDLLLWEGHKKLGKRWVEIATKFFNSSRSENHIKNRWYSASFKKFISNEFGPDAYNGTKGIGKLKDESKSKKKKNMAEDPTIKAH